MKRFILGIVIAVFLMASVAYGQTWHLTNQITMAWDVADNATSYKMYTKHSDSSNVVEVGTTLLLSYTYTFINEGRYFLGVKSIREVDGEMFTSIISWSDNPDVCMNAEIFGAVFYEPPEVAVGLRIE